VTIREPIDTDFAAIAAITNHYIATSAIHFGYEPVAEAELLAQAHDRFPWLVADDAGRVLGYAKAGTWRARDAYQWTCELGLYVAPDARGRGIGTALYAALLDACALRGFRSAIAGITLPNPASIALHERFGFAPVGVFAQAGYKLGAWHDVAFFQKLLAAVR
jgi:L-amino acid N-acyltransferase YncA